MSDHHHDAKRHGLPAPPRSVLEQPVPLAAPPESEMPVHFWEQGPQDVEPVAIPYIMTLRNGSRVRITHRMPWYLGRVEGVSRRAALKAIFDVLLNGRSWSRSGVHWVRTFDPAKAKIVVQIVPDGQTVCGPGAAGCYSWGGHDTPKAEVEAEYVADPGAMSVILGMELCGHGTFRQLDMYNAVHNGYVGVMGTWEACRLVGYFPADHEIASAKQWLRGETTPDLIHED